MKTMLLAALLISSSAFAADYTAGKYNADPAHTRMSFTIPHFVVSEVEGRFNDVKGDFVLDKTFTKSKITAEVPVGSIDTGVKQRDDHLKSKDFFEVEKYPAIKIKTKSITGTPESFKLTAAVTIKDVTKDIVFDGKYTGSAKDPWGNQRAAIQLTGTLNRKDFHINYDDKIEIGPAVGDEVKIKVITEGILDTGKKK